MNISSVYGITASKNKAIKAFLLLMVAVSVILGTSGCGSSLTDSEVFDKVEELAPQYRPSYRGIKCRFVIEHMRLAWQLRDLPRIFSSKADKVMEAIESHVGDCDEFWGVKIENNNLPDRDQIILCRRGTHFYIVDPKDKPKYKD